MPEDIMIEWQNVCSSRNGDKKKGGKMIEPAPGQILLDSKSKMSGKGMERYRQET